MAPAGRATLMLVLRGCARINTMLLLMAVLLSACVREPGVTDGENDAVSDSVVVGYREVMGWPQLGAEVRLGEVAGIDVDAHGHVFLFHRGGRGWDTQTITPIDEATVLQLDAATGRLLAAWGAGRFRLPHGLTVDAGGNVWLTDAALHQVFQFSHDGAPIKVLGEAGVGRWDASHFNRPTDVSVLPDGRIYISDGYENQRLVEFDTHGEFRREWGRRGSALGEFALPHALAARAGRLYVADRENGRVVVLDTSGVFRHAWSPAPGALIYAVALDSAGHLFAGVRNDSQGVGGIVQLDADGRVVLAFGAAIGAGPFLAVHDLALDAAGVLYVAENRSAGVRKFEPVKTARAGR